MTRWLRLLTLVASSTALALPVAAKASLIGDTVDCSATGGLICAPPSAVVSALPPPEFTLALGTPVFNVDIGSATVLLVNTVAVGVGGSSTVVSLTSLGNTSQGAVIGATLDFSDVGTFTQGDVSFTADSLLLDLTSTSWAAGQDAQITLLFANEPGSGPGPTPGLPEPSTLVLLIGALLGVRLCKSVGGGACAT
jgi:hypothetical protein